MALPSRVAPLEDGHTARPRRFQCLAPGQERSSGQRAGPGIPCPPEHGVCESCAPGRLIIVDLGVTGLSEEFQHLRLVLGTDDFLEPDELPGVLHP